MTIGEMSSWLLDNDDNIAEYNYKSGTWAIVTAICCPRDKSLAEGHSGIKSDQYCLAYEAHKNLVEPV